MFYTISYRLLFKQFKVFRGLRAVYSLLPFLPISRANFPNLVNPLHCLHQSQRLIHGATDSQVVDAVVSNRPSGVEEDETAEGYCACGIQNSI